MAHFAQLNESNVVTQVIVVHNNELIEDGVKSEDKGIAFCQSLFPGTTWIQTSYNGNMRKNYAGQGFTYDAQLDAFIPPQPYPSWVLNTETCQWEAPIPYPDDGGRYVWDEDTQSWISVLSTEPSTPPTVI
jgi:hypothetical protein